MSLDKIFTKQIFRKQITKWKIFKRYNWRVKTICLTDLVETVVVFI